MGIYIDGMEMPKVEFGSVIVAIRPDGMVEDVMGCYVGKAVPIPPHGDLIDVEELMKKVAGLVPYYIETGYEKAFTDGLSSAYEIVKASPTIITASEEGET